VCKVYLMRDGVFLGHVKGCLARENGAPALDGRDGARGKTSAVAQALDAVEDGHGGVARQEKVGVE
jgi:hypothetical protein